MWAKPTNLFSNINTHKEQSLRKVKADIRFPHDIYCIRNIFKEYSMTFPYSRHNTIIISMSEMLLCSGAAQHGQNTIMIHVPPCKFGDSSDHKNAHIDHVMGQDLFIYWLIGSFVWQCMAATQEKKISSAAHYYRKASCYEKTVSILWEKYLITGKHLSTAPFVRNYPYVNMETM